jgi:plastocyanin
VSVGDLEPQTLVILGVPGAPTQITLQGESQETVAGGVMMVSALVHDTHGNPVSAVPITLTVLPDSASLDTSAVTTDAQGLAQVILHTSPEAGNNEVHATVADLPLARFIVIGHQPTSLQITPQTVDVAMRGSYRFRAMATDAAGHTVEVVPDWTVVGVSGTISADGTFTATQRDTDVILATYAGLTTGALLTVVPGEIAMLQVTPAEVTVASGTTHQFEVTAFNTHRYPLEISPTWQVTNEIGSIDTSGLFSAAKAGNGEIVVTAGGVTGRAQVTVTEGELAAIVVSPDSLEVQAGQELQLQAIGHDAAGNQVPIEPTWKLTANLGELDASGRFGAKYAGQGRIQVEAGDQPIVVSVPVEVRPAALDRIEVEPQTLTLSAGDTVQFTATGFDTFGNIVDITPSDHRARRTADARCRRYGNRNGYWPRCLRKYCCTDSYLDPG